MTPWTKKTMKSRFKYIGIDPGASGGIAVIYNGKIEAYKCPKSSEDMAILFQMCMGSTTAANIKLLMERVWARPTNAVRAAFSYGVNYGQSLEQRASDLYPSIKRVTLATADAILITHYAKEEHFNENN